MAVNPASLTPEDLARVLSAAAKVEMAEMVKSDIEAGAPTNPDGTLNLIHYTAWLAKEEG